MGGRLHPEWWQVCPGISGRVGPEYAPLKSLTFEFESRIVLGDDSFDMI